METGNADEKRGEDEEEEDDEEEEEEEEEEKKWIVSILFEYYSKIKTDVDNDIVCVNLQNIFHMSMYKTITFWKYYVGSKFSFFLNVL